MGWMPTKFWPYSPLRIFIFFVCVAVSPLIHTQAQSGATLAGVLVDKSGAVIAGASVYLYSNNRTTQVVSDETGQFEFSNLSPGTYRLEVKKSGFETATIQPLHIAAAEAQVPPLTITMDIGVTGSCSESSSVSYEERTHGGAPLVGRIQPKPPAPEPVMTWPSAPKPPATWPYVPFSRATVELLSAGTNHVVASTHPDVHGRFKFTGIAVGEYVLRAKYKGYYDALSVKFEINRQDVTDVAMPMVAPGETAVCM